MSLVQVAAECCCGSIGRTDLRQCPTHFHIYNGDVRLTSVGRVVKHFFPLPDVPPYVLENARDRGKQVDELFADYVRGKLKVIPAGTRRDAVDLLYKLVAWYDRQKFSKVEVQVLLGGSKYGGIVDFIFDGCPTDLKATSEVLSSHEIQVGGYADLFIQTIEAEPEVNPPSAILHVTKALKEARLIDLRGSSCVSDWRELRAAYEVLERRGVIKEQDGKTEV